MILQTETVRSELTSPLFAETPHTGDPSQFVEHTQQSELSQDSLILFDSETPSSATSTCRETFHSTPLAKKRKVTLSLEDPLLPLELPDCSTHGPEHTQTCCDNRCFTKLSPFDQMRLKTMFSDKSRAEQQQFLLDSFCICRPVGPSNGTTSKSGGLMLQGIPVCKAAFLNILGVTEKRFRYQGSKSISNLKQSNPLMQKLGCGHTSV